MRLWIIKKQGITRPVKSRDAATQKTLAAYIEITQLQCPDSHVQILGIVGPSPVAWRAVIR